MSISMLRAWSSLVIRLTFQVVIGYTATITRAGHKNNAYPLVGVGVREALTSGHLVDIVHVVN